VRKHQTKSRTLTLTEAAREFRTTRETVKRRLRAAEVNLEPERWSIFAIHSAMVGDMSAERIRKTRAEADLLELDRRAREKELVSMDEAREVVRAFLTPARELLLSAPSALAARVNPSDPELARLELQDWVDNGVRKIREALQKAV